MFCPKCGAQAPEDAAFCQKCGAKLQSGGPPQPESAPVPTVRRRQPGDPPADQPKKKSKAPLFLVLGIVLLVVVAAVILFSSGGGDIDCIATVKAHKPFAVSQDLPYTYGEVFDQYLPGAKWEVREAGDTRYVDISGTGKGVGLELSFTVAVTADKDDPDRASIVPKTAVVDGEKAPTENDAVEFLLALFAYYDTGAGDLSKFAEFIDGPDGPGVGTDVPSGGAGASGGGESADVTDTVLFRGVPIDDILGAPAEDIVAAWGEPEERDEWTLIYDGYQLIFSLDVEGDVSYFSSAKPEEFTLNGNSFYQAYEDVSALFGADPDSSYLAGDGVEMIWYYGGNLITLQLAGETDIWTTQTVFISTGEPMGYEDDYEDYEEEGGVGDFLPDLPDGFVWVEEPYVTTDDFGFQTIHGAVQNISAADHENLRVTFSLYDSEGYRMDDVNDYLDGLGSGEKWKFSATSYAGTFASYEFSELSYRS